MKLAKVAIVCAAFASAAACADSASNALGVLKVDNANLLKTIPVAVNFQGADGAAVSVAKAVKTAGLPEGTLLYAFDAAAQKYVVYAIDGDGWKAQQTYYFDGRSMTEVTVSDPDAKTLPAGTAVFVKIPDSAEIPAVYTVGAVASGERPALTTGANLCSFPVGKAVDLNAASGSANYAPPVKAAPVATTFLNEAKTRLQTVGDTIVVPKSDNGGNTVYYYDGSKWGYIGKASGESVKSFITTSAYIPGGLGFWYNSVPAVSD